MCSKVRKNGVAQKLHRGTLQFAKMDIDELLLLYICKDAKEKTDEYGNIKFLIDKKSWKNLSLL